MSIDYFMLYITSLYEVDVFNPCLFQLIENTFGRLGPDVVLVFWITDVEICSKLVAMEHKPVRRTKLVLEISELNNFN